MDELTKSEIDHIKIGFDEMKESIRELKDMIKDLSILERDKQNKQLLIEKDIALMQVEKRNCNANVNKALEDTNKRIDFLEEKPEKNLNLGYLIFNMIMMFLSLVVSITAIFQAQGGRQ